LLHSIAVGGDSIDDPDLLSCTSPSEVLGHRVMAPSTLGTFLRSFTFGHVRQLDMEAPPSALWDAPTSENRS
jgi:hypothetical protein